VTQLNPTLSFSALYNKFGFIRRANDLNNTNNTSRFLVNLLTSLKNVSGAYTRTQGTFLPGYLPSTTLLGQNLDANAPGWDFLFGSQADIRPRAIANGWITRDSLQNQLYINTDKKDMNFRAVVEPVQDLRIELTAVKSSNFNYSTNFKYLPSVNGFESLSPVTSGDYSISFLSLRTAFNKGNGTSGLFRKFEDNRSVISQRLGAQNPNSAGATAGFAEGYGKNSQDVVIHSFLSAYTGKDPGAIELNRFPTVPIPNWRITYNGPESQLPFHLQCKRVQFADPLPGAERVCECARWQRQLPALLPVCAGFPFRAICSLAGFGYAVQEQHDCQFRVP
jgi:cell surface protein SprA